MPRPERQIGQSDRAVARRPAERLRRPGALPVPHQAPAVAGDGRRFAAPLSDDDLGNLAAYYSALQPKWGPIRQASATAAAAGAGADPARRTACNATARALPGQDSVPRIAGQQIDYLTAQLKAFRAATRGDIDGNMTSAVSDADRRRDRNPRRLHLRPVDALTRARDDTHLVRRRAARHRGGAVPAWAQESPELAGATRVRTGRRAGLAVHQGQGAGARQFLRRALRGGLQLPARPGAVDRLRSIRSNTSRSTPTGDAYLTLNGEVRFRYDNTDHKNFAHRHRRDAGQEARRAADLHPGDRHLHATSSTSSATSSAPICISATISALLRRALSRPADRP